MAHDPVGSGHSGSSVEDWLRNHAVSNGALPANLRPESVAFLQRLVAASVHRDATEQQLATDAQRRAAQHATEQVGTEDVLQQCGLAPNSMPTAVSGSLDMLSSAAIALGTRDTALCSLYSAFDSLETEEGEIASSMRSEDRLCSALQTRIAECQSVLQQLLAVEQECQQHATRQAAEHHGRAQDMTTLEKKSIQYKQDIARLKEHLKASGVREKLYHSKMLDESEGVLSAQQLLVPLRAQIHAFEGLPSDMFQAKQHVKEARDKLQHIETQLELSIRNVLVGGP